MHIKFTHVVPSANMRGVQLSPDCKVFCLQFCMSLVTGYGQKSLEIARADQKRTKDMEDVRDEEEIIHIH